MCYQYNTKEINEYLNEADLPELVEFEVDEIEVPNIEEYIHTTDGVTLMGEGEMI